MRKLLFDLRLKTWPARVWLVNLSWLPLWWVRKHVPQSQLTWTPAATIRVLSKRVEYLEEKNASFLKQWHKCELDLRAERMARVSDTMTEEQKEWAKNVMGVKFRGSEEN